MEKTPEKVFLNQLRKPSEREIRDANDRRKATLAFLDERGVRYPCNNLSKPCLGDLSPGCRTCMEGTWSCLYINGLCTRKCFYCPQDRGITKERLPATDEELSFKGVGDYMEYLKDFDFKGIGFSGGEPFFAFDVLLEYLEEIRRVFGSRHYIWVYTNGDLVTEDRLRALKTAGLDEIRFDLSARDYDLKPVALAARHIDTVTIEIPAIPEDKDRVMSALKRFEETGVQHLNLHQLMVCKWNYREFVKRNYTATNTELYKGTYPMIESELTALDIMKYAVETGARIGINYCSECYKTRFQGKADRKRYWNFLGQEGLSLTEKALMRGLSIEGSRGDLEPYVSALEKGCEKGWRVVERDEGWALVFPSECLEKVIPVDPYRKVHVTYYTVKKEKGDEKHGPGAREVRFGNARVFIENKEFFQCELKNRTSAIFFQKLFVERKGFDEAADEVMTLYKLEEDERQNIIDDIENFHGEFDELEHIPGGIPDYD